MTNDTRTFYAIVIPGRLEMYPHIFMSYDEAERARILLGEPHSSVVECTSRQMLCW